LLGELEKKPCTMSLLTDILFTPFAVLLLVLDILVRPLHLLNHSVYTV